MNDDQVAMLQKLYAGKSLSEFLAENPINLSGALNLKDEQKEKYPRRRFPSIKS